MTSLPRRTSDLIRTPLPRPDQRMTPNRKARIVDGVAAGELTIGQAIDRYGMTISEYLSWERKLDNHGVDGLRMTRLQQYRVTA